MCGIVGYIGNKKADEVIIDGLRRLEYRGYDSAGIAVINGGKIELRRSVGKLKELEKVICTTPMCGTIGIGHTRWATHGRPSEENAHPHTDCTGRTVVVHNGIIENYLDLKKALTDAGHKFKSQTDTEIIAHVFEKNYKGDMLKAVFKTLSEIKGAYALGIINSDNPDTIIAARKDAPLIVGVGEKENFIASDVTALLPYTKQMIFLEEGDVAKLTAGKVEIFTKDAKTVTRPVQTITWNPVQAEKGGYTHFMLKEIYEQSQTIRDTFLGRINPEKCEISFEDAEFTKEFYTGISKLYIIACGTSYHAGMVGKFLFESLAKVPVEVDIASEFRYRSPVLDKNALVIIVSQSGETADTLAALRLAKEHNCKTLSICNVVGSTASREAERVIYTRCGPEIGVASTKAFTGQLTVLYMLAMDWAMKKGTITDKKCKSMIQEFWEIPMKVSEVLKLDKSIAALAHKYSTKRDFLFLGRHLNYPIALEGALKLKEISYIHAEGYAAGEMKHGPIALIDENMPVMVIATESAVYEKILGNIEEAKARAGTVIALATEGNEQIKTKTDDQIYMPKVDEVFSPMLNVIPLQLFAYHVSVMLGCDVDQPRNLAKSVTVE
jgi:glucosamine--fructose-6-phosphate aminotransferase (isomerizing)